jgi:hypothetical protein
MHNTLTPTIDKLGLPESAMAALRRNGFVHAETRGTKPRFRLHFRVEKRQVVIELGLNASRADGVRRELAILQGPLRSRRRVARLAKEIRQHLRGAKKILIIRAEAAGLRFHGRQPRRPRRKA